MADHPNSSGRPPGATAVAWSTAADRVAVVVNGNARGVTEDLVEMLDQIVRSGDLFVSRDLEEGRNIARTIVERGYPTVLTGGGDGTFVQMVTWIVRISESMHREPPRFGFLKLGTGNALAWVLGAQNTRSRGVMADLGRLRDQGGSRLLRMIEVEDLLTPFSGIGADAIALSHYEQTRQLLQRSSFFRPFSSGAVAYTASILGRTIPEFLWGKMLQLRVINNGEPAFAIGPGGKPRGAPIEKGAVIYRGPARILAFSTIPYWGFGARVFPFAEEREDRFSLRIANFGSVEVVTNLRSLWQGTYQGRDLHDFLVESIEIHSDTPTPLQIGGDVVGRRTAIHAKLSKRPIRVVDYYSPPPQ